jgi:PilZ domain
MSLSKLKLSAIGPKPDPQRVWMVHTSTDVQFGPFLAEEVLSLGRHAHAGPFLLSHMLRPDELRTFAEIEAELVTLMQGDMRQGHPRAPCQATLLLQLRDQTTLQGRSIDLASRGMLMRLETGVIKVGAGFNLVASSNLFIHPFTTRGRVARKAADGIYGIEFLEPSEDAARVIDEFLMHANKMVAA